MQESLKINKMFMFWNGILKKYSCNLLYWIHPRALDFGKPEPEIKVNLIRNVLALHFPFQMYQFAATGLRMNTIYIQVYVVWMKFIFVEMFPYIIIIVLNALIILR